MNQLFWEFDLKQVIELEKCLNIAASFLGLPSGRFVTKDKFWSQIVENPSMEMVGYSFDSTNKISLGFRSRVDFIVSSRRHLADGDRLKLACKLAASFQCEVLTGDFTLHSEQLLVTPNGDIYFVEAESDLDGWLHLKTISSNSKRLDDLIVEINDYE